MAVEGCGQRDVPRMVYQAYTREHTEAEENTASLIPAGFERKLFVHAEREGFIRSMLGGVVLERYISMSLPAHRADFFRYVLLFFCEGAFDTKSALLVGLQDILGAASSSQQRIDCLPRPSPSLRSYAAGDLHSNLKVAWQKANTWYMAFCKHMWNILSAQTQSGPQQKLNLSRQWGFVLSAQRKCQN